MLIVIPYPNGEKYLNVGHDKVDEIQEMRKQILDYVHGMHRSLGK